MNKVTRLKLLSFLKQALIFVIIYLSLSFVMDLWRGKDLPKDLAPSLVATTVLGNTIDLHELSANQVVAVYFWGTWCGACKITSPSISSLTKHYPVVTVAMRSGSNQELSNYLHENNYRFDVINDYDQSIAREWRIPVTPVVFFIKDGEIKSYTTGASFLPGLWWRAFIG